MTTQEINRSLPEQIGNLWTEDDVCRLLQIKIQTLRKWRCQGKAPASFKIGRSVRFHPEVVYAWCRMKGYLGSK